MPLMVFCLVLTVIFSLTAFNLISINSSCYCEMQCCPASLARAASPSHSLSKCTRESLAGFEEASLLSWIRPWWPTLPQKWWPKLGLEHILFSRLFAFCTFSVCGAGCSWSLASFRAVWGESLFFRRQASNCRLTFIFTHARTHTQSIPSNYYSLMLTLHMQLESDVNR